MNLKSRQLGKYDIVERLGRGGMAEVFKGFQPSIERFVAIKVMHKHLAAEDQFVERFRSEAKGIAQLRHHNIVRIIDFDIEDDLYYMVLDYIEGQTLRAYLKKNGLLGPCEALYIVAQLADALAYAHRQGIIHRDIKPGNIMFMDDSLSSPVLTDFGLVRILGEDTMTMTGAMMGTPAYMSPEALRGEKVDARGDIYSLGVVLYEMVVGRTPYISESPYGMIMKQLHDPLPAPREVNPDLPEVVEQLILKAMAKDVSERFQSAKEFCLAIQETFSILTDGQLLPFTLTKTLPPKICSLKQRKAKAKYSTKPFLSLSGAVGGSVIIAFLMVQLLLGGGDRRGKARNTSLLVKPTIESVVMAPPSIAESSSVTAPIVPTAPKDSRIVLIEPSSDAIEAPQAVPSTTIPPQVRQEVPTVIPPGVHLPAGDHLSAPEPVPTKVVEHDMTPTEAPQLPAATPTEMPQTPPTMPTEVPQQVEVPQTTAAVPTEVPQASAVLAAYDTPTELPQLPVAMPTEVPQAPATAIPTYPPQEAIAVQPSQEQAISELFATTEVPPATAIPTEVPPATAIPTEVPPATAIPTEVPPATAIPTEVPPATAIPTEVPPATAIPTEVPPATPIPTEVPPATAIPTEVPAPTAQPTQPPQPTQVQPQPTEEPNLPTPTSQNTEPADDNSDQAQTDTSHGDDKGDNKDDKGDNGQNNSTDDKGDNGQKDERDDQANNEGSNKEDNGGNDAQDNKNDEDKKDEDKKDEDKKDEDKKDEDKKDEDKKDEDKGGDEDKNDDK